VHLLADGASHSGTALAGELGLTRAAVWKHIHQLQSFGLEIQSEQRTGYCLSQPLELLAAPEITAALSPAVHDQVLPVQIAWSLESTNTALLAADSPPAGRASVCLAEFQTGGRGRRGRSWYSPIGHGLCMSVGWRFASSPAALHCLGLVAGVAVLRALRASGLSEGQLKWPNDVLVKGKKLAGLLIDVQGESGGPLHVIIGAGLNYLLNAQARAAILAQGGMEPAAYAAVVDAPEGRNRLAAQLISALVEALGQFEQAGFSAFVDEWRAADYLAGAPVDVQLASGVVQGIASGISNDGQLKLQTDKGLEQIVSGDVSVRVTM